MTVQLEEQMAAACKLTCLPAGRLERFPESDRVLPEFPELPYREVIVAPYRFFYRVAAKTVWIVSVWHGAQTPEEPERGGH